jgi:hypothetical protein
MNKEQEELLGEAFKNYLKDLMRDNVFKDDPNYILLSKEEFINKCKTDTEFSEKWGLKIEERELSLEERVDIFNLKMIKEGIRTQIATVGVVESYWKKSLEETRHNIPTKLITITYNDKTIESYE